VRKVRVRVDVSDLIGEAAPRKVKRGAGKGRKIIAAGCDRLGKVAGPRSRHSVPPLRRLESFDDSGRPRLDLVRDKLEFDLLVPDSHRQLALRYGNREMVVPLEQDLLRPDRGVVEAIPVRSGDYSGWTLTVLSDCFLASDRERFLGYCEELVSYLASANPFTRDDVWPLISVVAWWAPTASRLGRFDCDYVEPRRIYGDARLVKKFMRRRGYRARANDLVLVLVDHDRPGGAGETSDDENIAWASPRVHYPDRETWFSIALHEIGHAFGLDDEYEEAWDGAPPKVHGNVSAQDNPLNVPWSYLFADGAAPAILRSVDRQLPPGHFRDHPTDAEIAAYGHVAAGMFEGARYQTHGWWRSALVCKMRIASVDFCDHCANMIARAIKGMG
jgi:IgA Peptidase M64